MIGAVLTYVNKGTHRVCGQTVGADGSGTFAVLFESESVDMAHEAARQYLGKLIQGSEYRGHISEIHLIPVEEYFCGSAVEVIKC